MLGNNVHELVLHNWEDVAVMTKILTKNGYVVMTSLEEELIILNYVWSSAHSNRNDVVFMDYDEFDDDYIYRKLLEEED